MTSRRITSLRTQAKYTELYPSSTKGAQLKTDTLASTTPTICLHDDDLLRVRKVSEKVLKGWGKSILVSCGSCVWTIGSRRTRPEKGERQVATIELCYRMLPLLLAPCPNHPCVLDTRSLVEAEDPINAEGGLRIAFTLEKDVVQIMPCSPAPDLCATAASTRRLLYLDLDATSTAPLHFFILLHSEVTLHL